MLDIRKNDLVEITAMGITVRGIVQSAANWGKADDPDWYIELTAGPGEAHYWKEKIDGGTVRKLENKCILEYKRDDRLIEITPSNGDGAHWGLTDLYGGFETSLRKLWESGVDFRAKWGSKKELLSATVTKRGQWVDIHVSQSCDEGKDLIGDAIWEIAKRANVLGGDGAEYLKQHGIDDMGAFTKYVFDRIEENILSDIVLNDPSFTSDRNVAYHRLDFVLENISEMVDETDEDNEANYALLQETIKWLMDEYGNRGH